MTIYFAIDTVNGLTLPNGEIVGIADDLARLRTNGFDAATYTGNRLAQIEHDASGWNNACEARLTDSGTTLHHGWYWIGGAVKPSYSTDIADLKAAIRGFQSQVVGWSQELVHRGVGQTRAKVDQGHDRLLSALGACYLICRNTSHSQTNRKIWISNMTTGANDIRKVDDFYSSDTATFPPNGETVNTFGAVSNWYCWIDISAPGTKLNLASSVAVSGTIPTSTVLLADTWVEALTA